jgi:hypothetical protein
VIFSGSAFISEGISSIIGHGRMARIQNRINLKIPQRFLEFTKNTIHLWIRTCKIEEI